MKPLDSIRVTLLTLAGLAFSVRTAVAQGLQGGILLDAWVGEIEVGPVKAVMQFRIFEDGTGKTTAFFDSVTEKRTDFEATWSIDGDTLAFGVPAVKATYRGRLDASGETAVGRFEQGGRGLALTLRRQETAYEAVDVWETRPQRPVPPFPYTSESVTFESREDGVTLAGTLTLPQAPGRHPAVILVSGSGPQDRDETVFDHKPFLVIADHLARRGVAVLRYDDRGTAESTGDFGSATTEGFARDASAALDFLLAHESIQRNRIGILGHSEGGLVAPMVAAKREEVAFVVLMAATGIPGERITYSQSAAMIRARGGDEHAVRLGEVVLEAMLAVVKEAEPGTNVAAAIERAVAGVVAGMSEADRKRTEEEREVFRVLLPTYASAWFRFFVTYDPRPALRRLRCPVLALNGAKDVQVLPDLNLPSIAAALASGGNSDHEVVELEGLNHMLQPCETGSMREYASIPETIDPAALERIGSWIEQRCRSGGR
jgi:pimeloyl-ACP methyl ester carboxylesterase